jgi:hypothetical protein
VAEPGDIEGIQLTENEKQEVETRKHPGLLRAALPTAPWAKLVVRSATASASWSSS